MPKEADWVLYNDTGTDFRSVMQGPIYADPVLGYPNSEVNYLKTFLTNRLLWMDDALGTITAIENRQNVSRLQNYPNPVDQQTTISYYLPKARFVKLSVYDVFGRKVETVVEAEQVVDSYEILYSTQNLPSGLYIYSLQLDNNVLAVRKLIISKH